jgi:hypothetical protein
MVDKQKQLLNDEDDFEVIELKEDDGDDESDQENLSDARDDGDDDRLESDQHDAQDEGTDGQEVNARQLRRKRQKERQKESMKRTREENAILLQKLTAAEERLQALEHRNIQSDAQTAEQRYNVAMQQFRAAEQQLKEAFETGDGEKAIQAQRLREQSAVAAREAEELKKKLANPQLQGKSSVMDPITESYAQQWMRKNPWFNPSGSDEDSAIARAIDEAWANEARGKGINPSSEQYWEELDERVRRRLGRDDGERKPRKSAPPVTGRGDSSRPSTSSDNKVYLSSERIKALKDAGVWDNPETRKRYIRRFQEYDRQNAR